MTAIENYALYGEADDPLRQELLHCEQLSARAARHGWSFRPHRHHGMHQFFWISTGKGLASIDGKERRIASGTAMSLPSMTVHGFDFEPGLDGWVVTIPTANLTRILDNSNTLLASLHEPEIFRATGSAEALFRQIAEEFSRFSSERGQALVSLAGLLAVWFAREIAASPERSPVSVDRGRDLLARYIRAIEDCLSERRPVAEHAARLGVTSTHLSRVCRRIAGRSASALMHDRIAQEARRELIYTAKPVSQIAYALGFDDPSHFSKFFRKQAGLSPSQFRNAALRAAPV